LKTAIISDIHANWEAFAAVLADIARQADVARVWCLGDVVGYGADADRCVIVAAALADKAAPPRGLTAEEEDAVAALRGKLTAAIFGNHDAAVLGDPIIDWFNDAGRTAALWTVGKLSAEARAWLTALPSTVETAGELLVHASPADPAAYPYITDVAAARRAFGAATRRLVFFGHTHVPRVIREEQGEPVAAPFRELTPPHRYLVNVGSVGQPRDGDNRAAYAVYDDAENSVRTVRLPYDIDAAAEKIRRAGLPLVLARRLYYGK
jgi:diadenosine tetraphosphatase ApaH/serine/threonine PP2A family protein phosphatase